MLAKVPIATILMYNVLLIHHLTCVMKYGFEVVLVSTFTVI